MQVPIQRHIVDDDDNNDIDFEGDSETETHERPPPPAQPLFGRSHDGNNFGTRQGENLLRSQKNHKLILHNLSELDKDMPF